MNRGNILAIFLIAISSVAMAQTASIPGYTGYAIPAEKDEEAMFGKAGLHNWTDMHQQISYYFEATAPGKLYLSILAKNSKGVSSIKVSIANRHFVIRIPQSKTFISIPIGDVDLPTTGFYQIILQPISSSVKEIADIQSIELSGEAAKGIKYNPKERRNAASVHLMYPLPDSAKVISFYNEIHVLKGSDIPYSYFMACGFTRGYLGIQVNSNKERRVIFSVWDAGNEAADRNKVADSNRVKLIAKGEGVYASDFGDEGTGGHSHWVYNWKADSTYKFLVTALPDSASNTTTYSGYFYASELKGWKLIASFRAPKDGGYLSKPYSFLEDFVGTNGQLARKAYYKNAWVREEEKDWAKFNKAKFSYDATGKAGDRTDFGGGVEKNSFYLWNGGFTSPNAVYGQMFQRDSMGEKPVTNLYNNVDSTIEAQKEVAIIKKAVRDKMIDTTGSVKGMWYKIIKEGTGAKVDVTDTLTVFYKGYILGGQVFDSTEKEPAIFPLNRLIKGFQLGMPMGKVGGKIQMIIPSGLAYTIRNRAYKIPPNSILVFDVEVISAKKKK
jgi:FKBP-type peptidyl-prolyl cis-trans isomerase